MEEACLEESVAESDSAERPRTYHDARREFAEDRRHLHHPRDRTARLGGEYDDSDLQDKEHHGLHAGESEIRIGIVRSLRPEGGRRERDGREQPALPFHFAFPDLPLMTGICAAATDWPSLRAFSSGMKMSIFSAHSG